MPLTMKDTGLVEGVRLESDKRPALVKALGGFYDEDRKEVKTGEVVACTEAFARYLISINRAERYAPVIVAPEPEQQLEAPAPAEEEQPTRRGRRHTKED